MMRNIQICAGVILLFAQQGWSVLFAPDARTVNYVGLEIESPAAMTYVEPYWYLFEEDYQIAKYEGAGLCPAISTAMHYTGSRCMMFSMPASGTLATSRSELSIVNMELTNETYFTAFAMHVPEGLPVPQNGCVFWQGHQDGDHRPPLDFNMDRLGNYNFQRNVDDDEVCSLLRDYLPRGSWRRYFVEYRYSVHDDGCAKVWVDGVKKLHFEGQTAYRDGDEWFNTKCGVYKPADALSDFTLYHDDIRWGRSSNDVWYGTQVSEIPANNSVIGHWRFDEETDRQIARDSAGECSYVGLLRNGTARTNGFFGGALFFDGADDYVSVPDSPIWDTGDALTVACRFKTSGLQPGKALMAHGGADISYQLCLDGVSGNPMFCVQTAAGIFSAVLDGSAADYTDGEWHHLVGIYDRYARDGNRLKICMDGEWGTPAAGCDEPILPGDEGISIGTCGTDYFRGIIDDVKICNYAWTAKEAGMYVRQNAIAYWGFNEGAGHIARDLSGNSNPMHLMNDDVWIQDNEQAAPRGGGLSFALRTAPGSTEIRGGGTAAVLDGTDDYLQTYGDQIGCSGDEFSVACRFRTSDASQINKKMIVQPIGDHFRIVLTGNTGDLYFYVKTVGGWKATGNSSFPDGYYADGKWHHVVGIYDRFAADGNRLKLYVDGVYNSGTIGYDEPMDIGEGGVFIGGDAVNRFVGDLDDVALFNAALSPGQVQTLYNGPVANYDFDENGQARIYDVSARCADAGQISGAVWTNGYTGSGLYFDGVSAQAALPDSTVWDAGSAVSVSCRFKTTAAQNDRALLLHDDSSYKYLLQLDSSSKELEFWVRTSSGAAAAVSFRSDGYADGQWHQVTGVYDRFATDGNRVKIFVDGRAGTPASGYNEDILAGDQGITIGRWSTRHFEGTMDDVILFNRALTALEISEL